jgi:uncharacterized protein YndB with AHSA1/START domain
MAIEVAIESTIEASPPEVFGTIVDLEAWPTWLIASGIRSVRRGSDGPLAVGEQTPPSLHSSRVVGWHSAVAMRTA